MKRNKDIHDKLPATFIVRIYRFPSDTQEEMVGVVETVGVEEEKGFNGIDELWAILNMAGKKRMEMK
jgi:hypothetical protein